MNYIQNIDYEILMFIQNHIKNPFFDWVMPIITSLGNMGILWIIIGMIFLLRKNERKIGIKIIVALVLCAIIGNIILKNVFMRTRPFDIYNTIEILIKKPLDFSFPSGHTMTSVAAATILLIEKKEKGILFMFIAFAIAFSRLYLFVHYPSDVFIGATLGILIAIISVKLINWLWIKIR
ncbi:MAG: phosphatase PAP2 family protein [Clostridiaceae bacterium]|nr:phosphatase PAP2 family protein [Clostridiaceae bacterium]